MVNKQQSVFFLSAIADKLDIRCGMPHLTLRYLFYLSMTSQSVSNSNAYPQRRESNKILYVLISPPINHVLPSEMTIHRGENQTGFNMC